MRREKSLLRRKAFRTFIVSFLLVFVMPLCLLAGFMANMLNTSQRQMATANQLLLEQYKSAVDGRLSAIKRFGDSFVIDERVQYFVAVHNPLDYLRNTTTFEMMRTLMLDFGKQNMVSGEAGQAYIHFVSADKVITNQIASSQDYFSRKITNTYPTYEAWQEFLSREEEGFVYMNVEGGLHGLGYVRKIQRAGGPAATIVIPMQPEVLSEQNRYLLGDGGVAAAVYNEHGALLHTTLAGEAAPMLTEAMLAQESGSATASLGGDQVRLLWSVSQDTGCVYLSILPEKLYAQDYNRLLLLSLSLLAIMLGGGIFLCYRLARRNYAPIDRLMSLVDAKEGKGAKDEFAYLNQAMQSLRDESLTHSQHLRHQRRTMRYFVLERLLTGVYASPMQLEEDLLRLDIDFDTDYFVVAAMRVEDAPEELDPSLMRFAVCNILDELLEEAFSDARTVDMDACVVAVLTVLPAQAQPWGEQLLELLQKAQDTVLRHFECRLTVAVSRAMQGYPGAHTAYEDARAALSALDAGALFAAWQQPEASQEAEMESGLSMETEQKMIHLLSIGEAESALSLLSQALSQCASLPRWRRRLIIGDVLSAFSKALSPTRIPAEIAAPVTERIQLLLGAQGTREDMEALLSIARMILNLPLPGQESDRHSQLVQKAKGYIQAHYREDTLCVTEIADHLGIGASYASMHYKQRTRESMLDTIHRMRLSDAKSLLTKTPRTVEDIALEVGYYNSAAFIRAFKKYEGVTPGQYRGLYGAETGR